MVRWSLTVSALGQKGAKKGGLSQYVEEAAQRLSFEETVDSVQERNLRYSEEEIEESINEAIRETRATSRS
ncbi:MAG: hypothetical protein EWV76_15040 [Microcystis novacekii Mn_MB_F_20050700_S1]|uniref:XACb0070 ribbon-helix-helix domain-containing protein n=1 Tax=Microcystis novacekii Mn_MB_F_20050700_S1D TaxID=2486266 RepID=A0A552IZX3_9CHRO|nr:MAG: hypothetical protein EWV76_15040 [Microcystis novacekii Mn_MB_F_20050700_S1]TRU89033.1 MAG: hypothetical protein EWV54_09195 [Microcystis novacekii Mn_MB_F_20050700_S1D]